MQYLNILYTLISALVPLLVGFIYYNEKVMGRAWMKATGLDPEYLKKANMLKIFGFTLLFSVFLSLFLIPVVLHVSHLFSLVAPKPGQEMDPNSEVYRDLMAFYEKYGKNYRTFGHGALHGVLAALFGAWPVIGINALFERRGWRYTAIHLGYWVITFGLMGGIICAVA
jgi:hypothetical protein